MTKYVLYGNSQLAEYMHPERKYRTNGHRILPLKNFSGSDGFGHPVWVDKVTFVEVEKWLPCIGTDLQYRWHYFLKSNVWDREYRRGE